MYSIIVSDNILCICDNSGIMSFYTSKYGSLLDEEPNKIKSDKSSDKAKSEETKAESDSAKSKQWSFL